MLQLKNLNIGYTQGGKTKEVLCGIDVSIGKGELIGLVGSNGIGKSTLLKTITGSLKPLQGNIFLDGKNSVIAVTTNIMPNRVTRVYFGASSVIELPAGAIDKTATLPGDQLEIA